MLTGDQIQRHLRSSLSRNAHFAAQGAAAAIFSEYAEARRWYRLSADQGWPDAYSSLGLMYHHGRGVVQDYVEAHMWFHLAATSPGFSRDRYYWAREREVVGAKMTAEQIAEAQRRAREWIEASRRPYPSFGSGTWGEFSTSPKR